MLRPHLAHTMQGSCVAYASKSATLSKSAVMMEILALIMQRTDDV